MTARRVLGIVARGVRPGALLLVWVYLYLVIILGGWALPASWGFSDTAMHVIGPINVSIKAVFLVGVVFWVRFTFPRFREDQLQIFAWKILIPISLVNIAVTAVLKVAF